jgi:hypothetical protein
MSDLPLSLEPKWAPLHVSIATVRLKILLGARFRPIVVTAPMDA